MKLIIGLGNPGGEYSKTRHNVGRRLVESIAAKEGRKFEPKKSLKAFVAELPWDCEPVLIAYPASYMNLSGGPVKALVSHCKINSLRDVLIVVDDVALPFGKFRLRGEGSSGGHNGLASVEECLKTQDYPRLRIGIGIHESETEATLRDYVLSRFDPREEKMMDRILEQGREACRLWALEPLAKVMSRVNSTEL